MMLFELKKAILETGYKQKFIAELAGLNEKKLSNALTCRCQLTESEKKKLAEILDEDPTNLFPEVNREKLNDETDEKVKDSRGRY